MVQLLDSRYSLGSKLNAPQAFVTLARKPQSSSPY